MGISITITLRKSDYSANEALFEDMESVEFHGDSMVSLHFCDINHPELEFESSLFDKRIPYDKSWESGCDNPSGIEYCRVLSNGEVNIKSFSSSSQTTIDIHETIQAYQQGNIVEFLAEQLDARTPMSWNDQETILTARTATRTALSALDSETLTDLVVSVTCDSTKALTSNKQSMSEQIDDLLEHGYLIDDKTAFVQPVDVQHDK